MLLNEKRRDLGFDIAARRHPHMTFLGNPGTVTEVQRTDLVAEYIGQTGPKTRKKISEAEGGILFVDEAYRLMLPVPKATNNDFGLEALEEIMSVMDRGNIVVIFAGYSEPMKRVISSNEGFSRRVTKSFVFDDLSNEELAQIVHVKMNKQTAECGQPFVWVQVA
ncbi:hypothetical protein IFM89_023033 [Coptis chinensis]|uniref:ATPase AAA-type core domain-containing protein n=1 Tax=Coptis chinensis TaxID=261450 RepID=A0A835M3U6_9MAGN|nr:hypothetical protein IFM89_023033 [Coptis chinensis]